MPNLAGHPTLAVCFRVRFREALIVPAETCHSPASATVTQSRSRAPLPPSEKFSIPFPTLVLRLTKDGVKDPPASEAALSPASPI